jgi:hypothetical protein
MREEVTHRHPDPRWQHMASYQKGDILGKRPIDGVYVTPNLPIDASTWLSFTPHLGDHCFAVIDIESKALVGDDLLKIFRLAAQHLSCSIPTVVAAYNKCLQTHMICHRILPQLHDLYSS